MFDFLKNNILYHNKYKTHSEAVIISCYFNPQKSPYRTKAFRIFYESIKHLNHHIVECVIGDGQPELHDIVPSKNRKTVYTSNLLWHKETLLNNLISELPEKYKYVFWLDADIILTNKNWLPEAVEKLQYCTIVQPFEYCFHLEQDEIKPGNFIQNNIENIKQFASIPKLKHPKVWRSFCANWVDKRHVAISNNYDEHGHVGMAWGAKREILEKVPLYDKALIGGADHIIAHAAVGQIVHNCISKSFIEDLDDIKTWSYKFHFETMGLVGYVKSDLYHIWHGEIENRQYLKRIIDFTPKAKNIIQKDENGLYVTDDKNTLNYMSRYFLTREVMHEVDLLDPTNPLNFVNPASPLYQVINAVQDDSQNNVVQENHHDHGHSHQHDNVHQSDSTINYNENFS